MAIGIDPTVDFACQRVLGSPEHPAVTLHFLNAVLRFPSRIREVQILNPTIEKGFENDKWSLLDVLAKDEQGRLTDCLRIHLFELPKYMPPSDNRVIDDPIEQWLYFFCRADESTAEELTARLPDPVFAEAAGVLEMIAKNPDERRLYNERLKMERDERARNLQARQEGTMIGRVQILQELNGLTCQSADDLARLSVEELGALEIELQQRLRERR